MRSDLYDLVSFSVTTPTTSLLACDKVRNSWHERIGKPSKMSDFAKTETSEASDVQITNNHARLCDCAGHDEMLTRD
jgi:hypothetical protein